MADAAIRDRYTRILRAGFETAVGESEPISEELDAAAQASLLQSSEHLANQMEHSILDAPWLRGPTTAIIDEWMNAPGDEALDLNDLRASLEPLYGASRALMIARTECLTADTLVDTAVVRAAYRRFYSGPIVEVKTKRGRTFSTTPNHPMLTSRSWVVSGELHESDYLVCNNGEKDTCSSRNQNVASDPVAIGEIFESLSVVGRREVRRTSYDVVHGDGRQGNVDVASSFRPLVVGRFAAIFKELVKGIFSPSDFSSSAFCRSCQRLLSLQRQTCFCGISPLDTLNSQSFSYRSRTSFEARREVLAAFTGTVEPGNFFDREIGTKSRVGFGLKSKFSGVRKTSRYARGLDDTLDSIRVDAEFSRNVSRTEPREIELDRVVSLRVRDFSGHVFNLSTPYGYYTINGAITGNTAGAFNGGLAAGLRSHGWNLVNWIAADDACPECLDLAANSPMTIAEYESNSVPHPNCSCSCEPAGDEDTEAANGEVGEIESPVDQAEA